MTKAGERIAAAWEQHPTPRGRRGASSSNGAAAPPPPKPAPSRGAQLVAGDVARLAGISPTTVRQHRRLGTMPPPDGVLGGRAWWWEGTISNWLDRRRGRGRPPSSSSR